MFYVQSMLSITICASRAFCMNVFNNIDLKTCKVTHLGLSFTGTVCETLQGSQCHRWDDVHHTNANINNEDFPDGSVAKAVNYCRNPTKDRKGPWCFTAAGPLVVKQQCGVPLCANQCRVTGPGMEYAGTVSESKFKKCEKWNATWHKRKVKMPNRDVDTFAIVHPANRFPEKHVGGANNFCRNPDGSLAGPWCYINSDKENVFEKSYCDVPMCDERANAFIAKQKHFYSHFISYNKIKTVPNLKFAVRLWHPDHEHKAVIKILLSILNTPTSTENLRTWATAVELTISNRGTGITIGNKSQYMNPTPDILKATEYSNFVVSWKNNVLDLYTPKESIYVEILSYTPTLRRHENLSLSHYSVSGEVAVWAFTPHVDDLCQEHTTFFPVPLFSWKLLQEDVQFYLELYTRSFHSAIIFLTHDPFHEYPRLSIKLGFPESATEVVYEHTEMKRSRIASTFFSIDYWSWTRLRVILLGNELRLMTYQEGNLIPLLTSFHEIVSSLRWFSIGSNESLSHWTLFCEPTEIPPAYPPDCVLNAAAVDYGGNQWVTRSGLPCFPWFAVEPKLYEDELMQLNYCRNYKPLKSGPWCYVQSGTSIKPEICSVRKCNAVICKKAGTANDYVGELSVTRSNFTCRKWPRSYRKRHKHEMYPNDFFEGNFCRNPTRCVGGAWCFTTDSFIHKDLCDVRDCDKRESRILITNQQKGNLIYTFIIPKWRDSGDNGGLFFSLKRWDPSLPEGIAFNIFSLNKDKFLTLYIGAKYNEELILRFTDNTSNTNVLLVRKIFPHIMPGGKWRDFSLKMPAGRLKLGYETKYYTILDWKANSSDMVFNPAFLNFESIGQDAVGIYFSQKECHVENTSAMLHSMMYPTSWQREDESTSYLTLYLRGSGAAIISLIHFPSFTAEHLVILIDDSKQRICLENNTISSAVELRCVEFSYDLISATEWGRYDIFSVKNRLYVLRNNIQLIKWNVPGVIVYYFFSVAARRGWTLWTANCLPPDIDSPLQDGGWSPWSDWYCSVHCGKGVGYRVRNCTSPKPTIFGKPCSGSSMETGFCNDFLCGNISPQTYDLLRINLQTKHYNIIAQEGDNVTFDSSLPLITRIMTESPNSQINWMHNGTILKPSKDKYCCNGSLVVTVKNISIFDSGLYVCVVKSNKHVNTPIKVVVVAVEPKCADVIVYNGSSLEMVCSSALETIYADLWIKWYLNDELFAATDIASIYFKNTIIIPVALWNHSGTWKCVMEQSDLKLRWIIKIHKVLVIQKPSLLTKSLQAYASIFVLNLMDCDEFADDRCLVSFGYITTLGIIVLILVFYFLCRSKFNKIKTEYIDLNTTSSTETQTSTLLKTIKPSDDAFNKRHSTCMSDKITKSVGDNNSRMSYRYKKPSAKFLGIKFEILKKNQNKTNKNKKELAASRHKAYYKEKSTESDKYLEDEVEDPSEPLLKPKPTGFKLTKQQKKSIRNEKKFAASRHTEYEEESREAINYLADEDVNPPKPLLKLKPTVTNKRTHSTMEIETNDVNYDDVDLVCTKSTCSYRKEYYDDDGDDYDFDYCGDDLCIDETCFYK